MSSEVRLVRPYAGTATFQGFLEHWRLSFGSVVIEPGSRAILETTAFVNDPVRAGFHGDDFAQARDELVAAAEQLGLGADALSFVVIVSTPYLRLAELVGPIALSDLQQETPLDRSQLAALRAPQGGCDVELAIVLSEPVAPAPLRPRRRGTWLGRVQFHARTDLGDIGFTPLKLTDDVRSEHELPANTVRFVEVEPEALLGSTADEAVSLYVDEDVLATLNQSPHTPAARSFQRQLFMDVMAAIVRVAPKIPDFDDLTTESLTESLLGRIVDTAARGVPGDSATAREKALTHLRDRPEVFLALLEDAVKPRDDLRHAIGGVD